MRPKKQEEITVEEVEEWMPSASAVDLEWLFCCSGPERTCKYFQFSSVKHQEDEEHIRDLCGNCFLQKKEGKAKWSPQSLKACPEQRRTGGRMSGPSFCVCLFFVYFRRSKEGFEWELATTGRSFSLLQR